MERHEAINRIRKALKKRTGRVFSVKGSTGTSWGWITINSTPKRQNEYGYMNEEDRELLKKMMNLDKVDNQGISIPAFCYVV